MAVLTGLSQFPWDFSDRTARDLMSAILRLILGREWSGKTPERWKIILEGQTSGTSVRMLLFSTRYLLHNRTLQRSERWLEDIIKTELR
jgi:hypothetical protein